MTEHWQVFVALLGVVAAWSLIIIAALRVMFTRSMKGIEEEVAELGKVNATCLQLERDIMGLKADLPVHYVRREDHIRDAVVLYSKIDKLSDKFDEVQKLIMSLIQSRGG